MGHIAATSTSPARQWTTAQRTAIETLGTSLLVSAAAGSGKTTVLAQRCVHLLCDINQPCEVDDLLVVTFTESAAAEMKSRIGRSLAQRHAAKPHERTARQLAMLDRAEIGTLHRFCAHVVRRNFNQLGIDPEFSIFDPDEVRLLKLETANLLFDDRYNAPDATAFRNLVDCYADGDDQRLIVQLIRTYDTLCSVVDASAWLEKARDRIEEAIDLPLKDSELGKAYLKSIDGQLVSIMRRCEAAGNTVKAMNRFPAYVDELRESYRMLKHWQQVFTLHGIDALNEVASIVEFKRLAAVPNSIEGKELAKSYVDSIRKEMKEGAWRQNLRFTQQEWKEGLLATLPHADAFLSLVQDFAQRYSKAKDETGKLDFSDLELLTLRSLATDGSPSPLARQFHQQFKHVLVDEYQDINQVQDAILSLVSRECLGTPSPLPLNLFCVGDVKQSIYRFRLAEPRQFLDRRDRYLKAESAGQVVDLQANFRSRAPLLEAINSVFERLMTKEAAELDYDKSQRLEPGRNFSNVADGFVGAPIELHLVLRGAAGPATADAADAATDTAADETDLDQVQREATLLGKRILEMVGRTDQPARRVLDRPEEEVSGRPIQFGDIVILLRAMRFKADQYAAVLRQMNVPVHTESATGYFESSEVNDVLSLLAVLDNQRQDIPLAALLRSPLARLDNAEQSLARIRLAYRGDPLPPFHLAVRRYAAEQTDDLSQFLRDFQTQLEKWRQEIRQRPVAELLWSIYNQTGYLAYVSGLPNGEQRAANLIELHDRARQFGGFERQGLGRFLTFLEKLKAETDLGQAAIASQADNVVRIMTIHASKGQEFPVVCVPDLGKAINLSDCQGAILLDRTAGLGLQVVDPQRQIRYPSLASTVVQQRLRQQAIAEELRVLYVAMTRAKEHLILAGSCTERQATDWAESSPGPAEKLPAEEVLSARSPLNWLGPIAGRSNQHLQVQLHNPDDLAAWASGHLTPPPPTPAQTALAKGEPPAPPPSIPPQAQAVIDRLSGQYPHLALANLAASTSVTTLVKKDVAPANEPLPSAALDRVLKEPQFLAGTLPLDAADKGTATHALLEHFDFSMDSPSIEDQRRRLVDSRRLTPQLAELVDLDAIRWFLDSEIGTLLRKNADRLQRELPVYYAHPSEATADPPDPLDQQMVRGRIDLLVPVEGGWMIVDYKTDRVSGEDLEQRAKLYAGQLDIYRKAIAKITGMPVVESALIFLWPRQIRRV